MSNHSKTRGVY